MLSTFNQVKMGSGGRVGEGELPWGYNVLDPLRVAHFPMFQLVNEVRSRNSSAVSSLVHSQILHVRMPVLY